MPQKIRLFWFRRDLRLEDNHGLYEALRSGSPVLPVFIFDRHILDELPDRDDARVNFIYARITDLNEQLAELGVPLLVRYGFPEKVMEELVSAFEVEAVFANHDYEPYARDRDERIRGQLDEKGIGFHTFKDQVVFEKEEVVKENGAPYQVFTPYARKWKWMMGQQEITAFPTARYFKNFRKGKKERLPALEEMGFMARELPLFELPAESIIRNYQETRNFPALPGTTRAGVHLRFGTISIRQLVKKAARLNETYLHELIWREFFMQMLWQERRLVQECCRPEYENIRWRNREEEFVRWCEGSTGYPIVDAGMRELKTTGFMHNRVRMITASFLVKHLLVDWRWGEAWFARHLMDYELSSNNGNWQWVAGCGCDAAPYFRIFNPLLQTKRFDPGFEYISRWVPEWKDPDYPAPMVAHEAARERCLNAYKAALLR